MRVLQIFCLLLPFLWNFSSAQSYPKIRAAYINPFSNGDTIPDAFLERTRNAGYTHIIVEIYPTYLATAGEWNNNNYNKGIYNGGTLYTRIKSYFQVVNAKGMRMIPVVQVGTPDAVWAHNNPNSHLDTYPVFNAGGPNNTEVPSIAPGDTEFIQCFTDAMKVIQAAFNDANLSYKYLDYIILGYSEAFAGTSALPITLAYGTSAEDNKWLTDKNYPGRTKSDLVVASIGEKISLIRSVGGPLAKTRVVVYGDLFETESYKNNSIESLPDVPKKAKNAGLQNDLVFMQWKYETHSGDGKAYSVPSAFRCFTSQGFKIMYISSLKWCGQTDSQADDGLKQMRATISTSRKTEFRTNVIGGAVAGWCGPGYGTGTDISWTAIEWLKKLNTDK